MLLRLKLGLCPGVTCGGGFVGLFTQMLIKMINAASRVSGQKWLEHFELGVVDWCRSWRIKNVFQV